MNRKKMLKLQKHGWKIGSASDFLGLSREEASFIDLKILLARYMKKKRREKHLTQNQLARAIHSSQSRVAKIEKNDPSVSLDLMVRSLFALGTSKSELARAIA
jgi:DNA-binding XRE family transcriptional regulator